jgi:hypothetical protein
MYVPYLEDDRLWLDELRRACGMLPVLTDVEHARRRHGPSSYQALRLSQLDAGFIDLMNNRVILGALRYGINNANGKSLFDKPKSIAKRLQRYEETGNQEHLVDIANLCMIEFLEPSHPTPHWRPEDDGEHTQLHQKEH